LFQAEDADSGSSYNSVEFDYETAFDMVNLLHQSPEFFGLPEISQSEVRVITA
jgi:hypothetical protein